MESSDAFRVLASADRQYLLYELVERDGASTVGDLSQRIAARRHRTDSEKISDTEIDRARVRLVHIHLPQLLERDLVDIEWADGTVALDADAPVDQVLEAAEELDDWPPDRQSPAQR